MPVQRIDVQAGLFHDTPVGIRAVKARYRAPKKGYETPEKVASRERTYTRHALGSVPTSGHIFLMPSWRSHARSSSEVELVLSKGFAQSHMHVCDWEARKVRSLVEHYPQVHGYPDSVELALASVAKKGIRLAGGSIDLCAMLSPQVYGMLQACGASEAWGRRAKVVVNVLRSREQPVFASEDEIAEAGQQWGRKIDSVWDNNGGLPSPLDFWRLYKLSAAFPNATLTRAWQYTAKSPFLTTVFTMGASAPPCTFA